MKKCILMGVMFLAVACGDDAEELTCDLLVDPDFCWNARVAEAQTCVADFEETAVSEDDGKTCAYPDSDVVVNFNNQIPSEGEFSEVELDFAIEKDGEFCMAFREAGEAQVLETPNGTARLGGSGTTLTMDCGGTTYEGPGFELLDKCGFGSLPGHSWSQSSVGFIINLLPGLNDESNRIVDCDYAREEMPVN